MRARIADYNSGYKVVSLAKRESVKEDLVRQNVECIYLNSDTVRLYPDDVVICIDKGIAEKLDREETLESLRKSSKSQQQRLRYSRPAKPSRTRSTSNFPFQ